MRTHLPGGVLPHSICRALVLLTLLPVGVTSAAAQLRISGQADFLAMESADTRGLNRNFRTDSPFNQIRVRLFAQHWLNEEAGVFTEILFDSRSGPRLNGAYVVLHDIAGQDWLSVRAGLAPSLIGNFSLRSTYFNTNPLIGVPLLWQHRTTLDGSGLATTADLLRRRESNSISLPILYDACWNLQWEFMGEVGRFEYSVGVTPGSVSNPLAATLESGVQALARVGYMPRPELRVGISGAVGPYIAGPARDAGLTATTYPGSQTDYDQSLIGFDAEYSRGKAILFSEGYISSFEAPLIEEDLTTGGAYVEGRYDFLPDWFGAVRAGTMLFSQVKVPGSPGLKTGWDDDLIRLESSLTYRIAREIQIRGGWQHTRFLTGGEAPINLLAVQLRAVF